MWAAALLLAAGCGSADPTSVDDDDASAGDGPASVCGNGVIEEGETCDGGNFGAVTCADNPGTDVGPIYCTASCTVDFSECYLNDADDDGLDIHTETEFGTDPVNPDTDGDGFLDGEEWWGYSNPLDYTSWPSGLDRWPDRSSQAQADGVVGLGWQIGQIAPVETWVSHVDSTINLHQFYGYGVVISFGAVWCPPCNQAAQSSEALFQIYKDQGIIFIEVLYDGSVFGTPATSNDLKSWASTYGLTFPVVMNTALLPQGTFNTPSLPTFVFIDRELRVSNVIEGYGGDAMIAAEIQKLL